MTSLQKAEHLVRNHPANKELMELGFGCELHRDKSQSLYKVITESGFARNENKVWVASEVRGSFGVEWEDTYEIEKQLITDTQNEHWKILGKPAHLESYLRVIESNHGVLSALHSQTDGHIIVSAIGYDILFNLTTGKPATEKDAEEFIKLVQ